MAKVQNGWFAEIDDRWYGQALSLEVKKVLCDKRSRHQDILIFESTNHGNVLVLDGCIQCTDRDEYTYHEMITHLPLNSHPNPKKVLVIGAGDGGVIREIAKHSCVECIVQCEIDKEVVNFSKKYLPQLSCGYKSPRHTLHVGCGKEFMRKHEGEFDVVITDSSDPIGPAAPLFQKEYYELIKLALKPNGILCSQGECAWIDGELINDMLTFCDSLFPVVKYAYVNVPTYPCGQIGFLLCSRCPDTNFEEPLRKFSLDELESLDMMFYNAEVHTAAFAVPQFFKKFSQPKKEGTKTGATIDSNWFWEKLRNAPEHSFGLIKEDVLFHERTNNQDVLVFNSHTYGNVLVVDDVIQRTERDQSACDECLVHLALSCHPEPKKVLIIGGISGDIVNEVARYQSVVEIVLCEASQALLDVCKKYFTSCGYDNPKLLCGVSTGDYREHLKNHRNEYDVIITVPKETFLLSCTNNFLKPALKPNGIIISQLPSFWLELDAIYTLFKYNKTLFPIVNLAYSCIPTSPFGQTTFILRSLNPTTCFKTPVRQLPKEEVSRLYYYNHKIHNACFALPEFVRIHEFENCTHCGAPPFIN